ncbi:hypothetical protein AB0F52_44265 [Amycolatopsis sp. NPDC024027]|uniref:VMAP-C domain-containing protein n=1 Tax=Amycolatopsis sp. NPDC024027 TaxID=3154327 RepID=UPI00340834FE
MGSRASPDQPNRPPPGPRPTPSSCCNPRADRRQLPVVPLAPPRRFRRGWFPERGQDYIGGFEEIKYKVAVLAEQLEGKWAPYDPDIRLDFVLSRDLLHLDVDQWQWEAETAVPKPLSCHFPLGVRSLERMKLRKWHRARFVR